MVFELGVGYSTEAIERLRGFTFPFTKSPAGLSAGWGKTSSLYNVPDVVGDPRYIQIDPDIRSGVWVPVEHENQFDGVLNVLSTHLNAFTPRMSAC